MIIKPIIVVPLPSMDCEKDWDYQLHGTDWHCRCETGKEQSPIDIDSSDILPLEYDAEFEFFTIKPAKLMAIYHENMI